MASTLIVKAEPTKLLFLSMITADVDLIDAIADLVDNSIDGARRIRPHGDLTGLYVNLMLSRERFRIADNCGGIDLDHAIRYVFCLGRPSDVPPEEGSIGRFGIGMKRAIFKMGKYFIVDSKHSHSRFRLEVDLNQWSNDEAPWEFALNDYERDWTPGPDDELGTLVEVHQLHNTIANEFENPQFISRLQTKLEAMHNQSTEAGMSISIRGVPIGFKPGQLLASQYLQPINKEVIFSPGSTKEVRLKLYVGVAESHPTTAGWDIYCNGRRILEADKTFVTGWGDGNPAYHNQFARLKGFAFFAADDVSLLPWNTSKSAVDFESPVYRWARNEMIQSMRPVVDFLNKYDEEINTPSQPFHEIVEQSRPTKLEALPASPSFTVRIPESQVPRIPYQTITYKKPVPEINRLKDLLDARSNREVGEKSFDYVLSVAEEADE